MTTPFDVSSYLTSCQAELVGFPRQYLHDRGLMETTIKKYLLGWDNERQALVIPYLNALGETRKLRYRNMHGDPKYIWGSDGEKGAHLFHVKATRKPQLWFTEGEFDAMLLAQMGYPSVAVPGAKLFKPEWKYLFAYCEQLTVVFDADETGMQGAQRLSGILGEVVTKFRMARLPQGMDVTDLYLKDQAALEQLIK